MTARHARTMLAAGPSELHRHRGPSWKPAPILPEGETHTGDGPPAAAVPPAPPVPSTVAGQPPAQPPPAPAQPAAAAGAAPAQVDLSTLDPAVQQLITDLRKENGAARTNAKEQAAQEARAEMAKALAKAAGIDLPGENPDPEKLASDLTAAQLDARTTAVELAVFKAASKHQGDPDALLDSRAFLTKVAALDPKAADFQTQLDAAIKEAVNGNPKLKAGQVPGASGVPLPGGSGEAKQRPTSLGAAIGAHMAATTS